MRRDAGRNGSRVDKFSREWRVLEREGRGDHDRGGADDNDERADDRVGSLVRDTTRSDALVNDVELLKEELPRRDRGTDDGDDQEHAVGGETPLHPRDDEVVR